VAVARIDNNPYEIMITRCSPDSLLFQRGEMNSANPQFKHLQAFPGLIAFLTGQKMDERMLPYVMKFASETVFMFCKNWQSKCALLMIADHLKVRNSLAGPCPHCDSQSVALNQGEDGKGDLPKMVQIMCTKMIPEGEWIEELFVKCAEAAKTACFDVFETIVDTGPKQYMVSLIINNKEAASVLVRNADQGKKLLAYEYLHK
jgi:hypothetical protein